MQRSTPLDPGPAKSAKRKIDSPRPEDSPQQKTIEDVFTKGKATRISSPSLANKRLRRDSSDLVSRLGSDKMYSFTSSKPNGAIDLTGSPPSKPPKTNNVSSKPSAFTPHQGARKLIVKNLRTTPRGNAEEYMNKVWNQLDGALAEIFNGHKPSQSLEELYKGTENLCRQGKASEIAGKLRDRCQTHVSTTLREKLVDKAMTGKPVELLKAVINAWSNWNGQLVILRNIFYYMDQSYLLRSPTEPTITEMGLIQFRAHVFYECLLQEKILQGACALVWYDREGIQNATDPDLLRQTLKMFHDMAVYSKVFEPELLKESGKYFSSWAEKESANQPLDQFVQACHHLLNSEMKRCDQFNLDSNTRRGLSALADEHLVMKQKEVLLDKDSVLRLLKDRNTTALDQLFSLLERKSFERELKDTFGTYIEDTGTEIVFDEKREGEMVTRLLELKRDLDLIWKISFHGHEALGHTLRESFEHFINKTKKTASNWGTDNPKPGEMIAKYVDMILRGGAKTLRSSLGGSRSTLVAQEDDDNEPADEEIAINSQLDQVLDLFRFVHGKAVFEAFYKKDLARRLLMARSASADAENSMLMKLKNECGAGFTHNLEQMFKDMELARDEMASYKDRLGDRKTASDFDLSVNVLSSAAWPTYPDVAVNIPQSVSNAIREFDLHYKNKHSGRRLHWKHNLAHCQLRAAFPKGDKELVVSSFQAVVLLLFNDATGATNLSYVDIQNATGLSDDELKRTLQSLACAKYRVLTKHPKGRDVNPTDTFTYNANFSDPKYRIKINTIQLKETKAENKETHERVAADRHYETQAAIVRIMKSRKTIKHAELVAEVITATKSRGVLDPADIKKNIAKLIEKDYMERDEGNSYSYMA